MWKVSSKAAVPWQTPFCQARCASACCLAMRQISLEDKESVSKIFKASHYHTIRHCKLHLGDENTISAVEVVLIVKTLKDGKFANCDEIRPKALNQKGDITKRWLAEQHIWCNVDLMHTFTTKLLLEMLKAHHFGLSMLFWAYKDFLGLLSQTIPFDFWLLAHRSWSVYHCFI